MGTSRRSTRAARLIVACLAMSSIAPSPAVARPACAPDVRRVAAGRWETLPIEGIRGAPFTWRMAADERDPRLVVVADNEGILVTHDGGCTWDRTVEYVDALSPFTGSPVDAVVAGTGRHRSLHVLVSRPFVPAKLFSSFDDGASWAVVDVPAAATFGALQLTASASVPGRVYLLVDQLAGGAVYSSTGDGGWRLQSLALQSPEGSPCVTDPACPPRALRSIHADPAGEDLWGSPYGAPLRDDALGHSADEGTKWEYRSVPELSGGVSKMAVTPGSIVLASTNWEYALSRDGGMSWSVGKYPKVTSSAGVSSGVLEMAYFDRGNGVALLPGPTTAWSGNVLVSGGVRWTNAAPPEFAGYDREDGDGNGLFFAALASTRGPLLALSSVGDLMAFRPR